MPPDTELDLGPDDIVLDGDPVPPMERSTAALTFRPMFIVAKQLPISATAELLLFHCTGMQIACCYIIFF